MTLRSKLIRLAHENPELRLDILPLLKSAGKSPNREDIPNAIKALDGLFDSAKIPSSLNGGDVVNGGINNLPVPRGYESLFDSIRIEVRWVDSDYAVVSWKYTHPNGGSNGYQIGEIGKDERNGMWYWKNAVVGSGYV